VDSFRRLLNEIDLCVAQAASTTGLSITEVRLQIDKVEELLARVEAIRTARARRSLGSLA
jgi:hypothetical protein